MRRFLTGLVLALALSACGGDANQAADSSTQSAAGYAVGGAGGEMAREEAAPPAPPPPPDVAQAPAAAPVDADNIVVTGQERPATTAPPGGPNPVLYLAYTYNIGLELPSAKLSDVLAHHVQACQQAGPRLCQLVGSNISGDPESYLSGYVSLRGEPVWLNSFMNGISAEADAAGGRIKTRTQQSEDLTRQMVDTEARMRALSSLRDRLQELLRSRPGRLSDLLEVERELARVQGELDATQSTLAVMRTRVSMSELTLNYESSARPVGSDTFQPLVSAFANFLSIVVQGFAAIIVIIAGLLPFALVFGLIAWLALKWRKKNGGRFWHRGGRPAAPVDPVHPPAPFNRPPVPPEND